jgi:putative transposase
VPTRIPASERTSQKLDELLSQGVADGDARAELLKLAVRKIVEEALEAEVADAVGRGYYENGAPPGAGYRNGYRRGRLATAEGPIEYGVPQVADRAEPFVSRVRARLVGRTAELERLAVEMFARGLSTRDIEAAFRDASGASVLSRTAVSQVTERLWQEYEAFAGRDLSEFSIAYLFVGGRSRGSLPRTMLKYPPRRRSPKSRMNSSRSTMLSTLHSGSSTRRAAPGTSNRSRASSRISCCA